MRGRYLIVVASIAGCADFAGIGDPMPLAPDAPPAQCVFGSVDLCLFGFPHNDLVISAPLTISTDRDCDVVLDQPIGRPTCVLYARTIEVNAKLIAVGSRPLILAATDHIDINAAVDLSSYWSANSPSQPAASNDRDCAVNTVVAAGPGGSFAGKGGDGGFNGGNVRAFAAPSITLPPYLRGGCGGGGGKGQAGSGFGGSALNSGGAVAIVARNEVVIGPAGQVLANGAGGDGATTNPAGGGGSGGMIQLAAATVTIHGIVVANGGGGGEGSNGTTAGSHGADGTLTGMRASGGAGLAGGGDGGLGGATVVQGGESGEQISASVEADGGGGGGAGFVVISAATLATPGLVSPPPLLAP